MTMLVILTVTEIYIVIEMDDNSGGYEDIYIDDLDDDANAVTGRHTHTHTHTHTHGPRSCILSSP